MIITLSLDDATDMADRLEDKTIPNTGYNYIVNSFIDDVRFAERLRSVRSVSFGTSVLEEVQIALGA